MQANNNISRKTGHEFEGDEEKYMANVERGNRKEICYNYIIIKNIKNIKRYIKQLPPHSYIQ